MLEGEWQRVTTQSALAVQELALGLGVMQERLEGACDALLRLESRELPEAVREVFLALIATIMEIDDLAVLTDTAAVALARRIVAFHEQVLTRP